MSHRLQVLIPPDLDAQIEKVAQRSRVSKGEWVRRALKESLRQGTKGSPANPARDAVHAAAMLNRDIEWIATYDSGFAGIPGIRRLKL